ncbi:MAG TPA: hypothetical protein VNH84_05690, partial [Candidatus Saccharimonadales bacterium]|nr:hypothetical protein [Candidatus Saccharimonadales bacterium]
MDGIAAHVLCACGQCQVPEADVGFVAILEAQALSLAQLAAMLLPEEDVRRLPVHRVWNEAAAALRGSHVSDLGVLVAVDQAHASDRN